MSRSFQRLLYAGLVYMHVAPRVLASVVLCNCLPDVADFQHIQTVALNMQCGVTFTASFITVGSVSS